MIYYDSTFLWNNVGNSQLWRLVWRSGNGIGQVNKV